MPQIIFWNQANITRFQRAILFSILSYESTHTTRNGVFPTKLNIIISLTWALFNCTSLKGGLRNVL